MIIIFSDVPVPERLILFSSGDCTDGKLRIRGTSDDRLGRLEVCVNGTWSIICKDGWDDLDARVACQQLGYSLFG